MSGVFTFEEIDDRIGLLTFDVPGQKVNTLSAKALADLEVQVAALEKRTDLRGLLFRSGKPGQYIAGADLHELGALRQRTPEEIDAGIAEVHALFTRVSNLPFPTVALIDGPCQGGGTELSLSLDERLASTVPATKIGLPEVSIGILPGWGGTQRLPRLIGLSGALDMILGGKPLSAAKAASLGLVFDAVAQEALVEEGIRLIGLLRDGERYRDQRRTQRGPLKLSADAKAFAFAVAEGFVRSKTGDHYPAPLAALRAVGEGIDLDLEEALARERTHSIQVVGSRISSRLIDVFFMNRSAAKDRGGADESARSVKAARVGVLGAGSMGAGIAATTARRGLPTTLVDVDPEALGKGMGRARKVVESRIAIGRATSKDLASMLEMLSASTSPRTFSDCDVVIEAIPENEELKTKVFAQLEPELKDGAILASNTSTISITRMAEATKAPERFVGMHFFYPVDRMGLVEIIRGEKTDDSAVLSVMDLTRRLGKTPIVVGDCAGFLVNRILMPYMVEALALIEEGAPMDVVDKVATSFGMPVGPIALQDMVGLDTSLYAGNVMAEAYADRTVSTSILRTLVESGRLGKKGGKGFRRYVGKKAKAQPDPEVQAMLDRIEKPKRDITPEEIEDRLFLTMLLEAARALEEGIVREPWQVDLSLILGIGFPPFRGGLCHWADDEGISSILSRSARYADLGARFHPPDSLEAMAKRDGGFYARNGEAPKGEMS